MAKNTLKKMENLQTKITQLKVEQEKIEHVLVNEFIKVMKAYNAFQIDFDVIAGGIIEVIDIVKINPTKTEDWRLAGQKFRKSNIKDKPKRNSKLTQEIK